MDIYDIVEDIVTLTLYRSARVIVYYNVDTGEYDDYAFLTELNSDMYPEPGSGRESLVYVGLYDSPVTVDKLTADTREAVNLYQGLIYT